MKINLDHVKTVVRWTAGYTVAWVVKKAIVNNTTSPYEDESLMDKARRTGGTLVLGALFSELARDYVDERFDEAVEKYNQIGGGN